MGRGFILGVLALLAAAPGQAQPKIVPDFTALAREAMATLPPPPALVRQPDAALWTLDDLTGELAKFTSNLPRMNSVRTQFLRADHAWFLAMSEWFRKIQKPLHIRYVDELFDCDNYANCFVAFADLMALKAGENRASFCIGRATVYYRVAHAGVRAGTGHALVMVGTNKGFFLLDPQDGMIVSLAKFPNRDSIDEISF